jgi:hypothetical protein
MEFVLTMRMNLEALKELRELRGAHAEAEAHASFFENALNLMADELLKSGVHPEVIEEAFQLVHLARPLSANKE